MSDDQNGGAGGDVDLSEIQNADERGPVQAAGTESLDAVLSKKVRRRLPSLTLSRKRQVQYAVAAGVILVAVLMLFSCQPKKGSIAFGICSTYLELHVPYPETLNFTDFEGSRTAIRIYFTNYDPFGQYKLEMIECTFAPDPAMGMKVSKIARNRRAVDQAEIDKFNRLLPTIMGSDPYLVLPPNWKNPLVKE